MQAAYSQKISENWQWFGLWLILIFTAIYTRPLIPIDETRYLSVAWEMWDSNEFLVPHINGNPYSHKPPLLFWLIHLSWFIFGVGEWSGRIVAPLFGLGSIILTVNIANRLWPTDKNVGLAAPFVLLGTAIWSVYSSLTMFDTLLTFSSLLGLLCILEAQKQKSRLPWIGLGFSIGLGILAKGPIVLLYIIPPLFLAPWWSNQNIFSWQYWYKYSLVSFLFGLGIAGCWAIPAARAGGPEYEQAILFSQTAGRMVKAFAHDRSFYWYLLLTPLFSLPWFFWLPSWRGWRKLLPEYSIRFCLSAILPSLLLLSLVSGKQLHYVLPILPIGSLLVARAATSLPQRTSHDKTPLLIVFFVLSIALFVAPYYSFKTGDTEILQEIPGWIALPPIICGFCLFIIRTNTTLGSIKTVVSVTIVLIICLHLALSGPLNKTYDQTLISKNLKTTQNQGRRVAVFPASLKDQFQFSGQLTRPLRPKESLKKLVIWAIKHPRHYA